MIAVIRYLQRVKEQRMRKRISKKTKIKDIENEKYDNVDEYVISLLYL